MVGENDGRGKEQVKEKPVGRDLALLGVDMLASGKCWESGSGRRGFAVFKEGHMVIVRCHNHARP